MIDKTFGGVTKAGEVVRDFFKDFKGDMCGVYVQAVHFGTFSYTVKEENE